MNIGILTHPLVKNYGGILQAYALSSLLQSMGHNVIILSRCPNLSFFKRICYGIISKFHIPYLYNRFHGNDYINMNIALFVNSSFIKTSNLYSSKMMAHAVRRYHLDAVVVGSDQVWRSSFAMSYDYDYFLEFVPKNVLKISYAASFGLDSWDYSDSQTQKISELLHSFQAVSVRENSAVMLCEQKLHILSKLVLDPTLLLNVDNYSTLTSKQLLNDYVFVYWLGSNDCLQKFLLNYNLPDSVKIINLRDKVSLPSISDWLSYIKYSNFVITDSFHGCVFSLLFHKQFYLYVNESGGYDRIKTLFSLLNIEYKLTNNDFYINYKELDSTLDKLRVDSINFLLTNLVSDENNNKCR